jgi:hypothetical protein
MDKFTFGKSKLHVNFASILSTQDKNTKELYSRRLTRFFNLTNEIDGVLPKNTEEYLLNLIGDRFVVDQEIYTPLEDKLEPFEKEDLEIRRKVASHYNNIVRSRIKQLIYGERIK